MKFLFLGIALLAIGAGTASAQSSSQASQTINAVMPPAVEPKLLFSSKVNEVDAYLTRNRAELAQAAYNDLAGMMQQRIAALQGSDKASKAQKLYSEAKVLSADLKKNHQALVSKLHAFLDVY